LVKFTVSITILSVFPLIIYDKSKSKLRYESNVRSEAEEYYRITQTEIEY